MAIGHCREDKYIPASEPLFAGQSLEDLSQLQVTYEGLWSNITKAVVINCLRQTDLPWESEDNSRMENLDC